MTMTIRSEINMDVPRGASNPKRLTAWDAFTAEISAADFAEYEALCAEIGEFKMWRAE